MSYLHYLCLFTYSGVQHIYCVVFLFCFSSSMLLLSRVCPFLIAPSVFSNVYFSSRLSVSNRTILVRRHISLPLQNLYMFKKFLRILITFCISVFHVFLLKDSIWILHYNTTGATNGAGSSNSSGPPVFTPSF